jgi:IS66 C-terminal element
MRAARSEFDVPSVRTADASDIGPRHPARHGQNGREIALGRKSWLFAGSDRGGERAAVMYTLVQTARLNDADPQAWLTDVLAWINDHDMRRLDQLLPWNWKPRVAKLAA